MLAFFLGILFDETLRRLVIPWIRRHPENVPMVRGLCAGGVGGVFDEIFAAPQTSNQGMHYMSGGESFTDTLKAKAQERLAAQLVDQFADEVLSGCLGAVDPQCRAAMRRHLEWHRRRGELAGFHIPGLNALRRVAWDYNPITRTAAWAGKKTFRYLDRPFGGAPRGGGAAAPGPGPDDAGPPQEAPADDAQPDASQGGDPMLSSPTEQLVTDYYEPGELEASSTQIEKLERMADMTGMPHHLRHWRRRRHHPGLWKSYHAAVQGWGLSNLFHHPAGKLLVSATPGGTSAVAAHAIAKKALKNGTLKPEHLKAAGALAKKGRAGDHASLVKIAKIKQAAGRGDRHAEVALDRIKLAHSIQTGQRATPSGAGAGTTFRRNYARGAELMIRHHA